MQARPLWKNCCSTRCFLFCVFIVTFCLFGWLVWLVIFIGWCGFCCCSFLLLILLETICSNNLKVGWELNQLLNAKTLGCDLASCCRNMNGKMRTGFSDLGWFRTTFLRCEDSDKLLSSLQKWFWAISWRWVKTSFWFFTLHFVLVKYSLILFVCLFFS